MNEMQENALKSRARQLFEDLNTLLHDSDEAYSTVGYDVWAILTALRGPDAGSVKEKWLTTAVIRSIVAPSAVVTGADVNFNDTAREKLAQQLPGGSHFMIHIRNAYRALVALGLFAKPIAQGTLRKG